MAKTKRMPIRKKEIPERNDQIESKNDWEGKDDEILMNRMKKSLLRKNIINKIRTNSKREQFLRRKSAYDMNIQFISEVGCQKFNCPICMEMMLAPSILPCGHTFCLNCIEQSLKYNNTCSLCREIYHYQCPIASKITASIIQQNMQNCQDQEERKGYGKRIKVYRSTWDQVRVGDLVQVGDKVDCYVDQGWKQGTVEALKHTNKETTILRVKSCNKQREVRLDSRLIAKFGTFTKPKPKPQPQMPWRQSLQISEPLFFFDITDLNIDMFGL